MMSDYRKSPPPLKNPFPENTGIYRTGRAKDGITMVYLVSKTQFENNERRWLQKALYNQCEIKVIDEHSECIRHIQYTNGKLMEVLTP